MQKTKLMWARPARRPRRPATARKTDAPFHWPIAVRSAVPTELNGMQVSLSFAFWSPVSFAPVAASAMHDLEFVNLDSSWLDDGD